MKVTAQEEYGLRCLMQLTRARADNQALTAAEIAAAEGLATPFVGKILAALKHGGLATQAKGGNRSWSLSRNPNAIMLDEVLSVLGGRLFTGAYCDKHTGKREDCVHIGACNVRPVWGALELLVSSILRRISLADLMGSESAIRAVFSQSVQASLRDAPGLYPGGAPVAVDKSR